MRRAPQVVVIGDSIAPRPALRTAEQVGAAIAALGATPAPPPCAASSPAA